MNPKQKSALSKIFAVSGTLVLWAPIAFMLFSAVWGSLHQKAFLFDYLALAELFPIVALGLILLVLASLVSRTFAKWFGWGSVAALVALSGGMIYATVSGLASGALAPGGSAVVIVVVAVAVYDLVVVGLAVLGIVLVRRLFQKVKPESVPESTLES